MFVDFNDNMHCPHRVFDVPGTDLVFDIQYLKDKDGELLPKEVCVGSVDKPQRRMLWIVNPPYIFEKLPPRIRRRNNWRTEYIHGLHWFEGWQCGDGIELAELYQELREIAKSVGEQSRLYAVGEDTVQILEQAIGRKFIDLNKRADCPDLDDPPPKKVKVCPWHSSLETKLRGAQCALRNVKKLQRYLNEVPLRRSSSFRRRQPVK